MSSDDEKVVSITPKAEALRGLPPEWREKLIEQAAHMGVRSDHDTAWLLIGAFVNAWAAAGAAGEAAAAVRSGIEKIPDTIRTSTISAGNDLAATVAAGAKKIMEESEQRAADVTAKTEAAIKAATQAGSGTLRAAMQGLEAAAKSRQGQIVEVWQTALGRAAEKEAKATLIRVAGWRWTQIAGALLAAMALGAGLMFGGLVAAGKILPWG